MCIHKFPPLTHTHNTHIHTHHTRTKMYGQFSAPRMEYFGEPHEMRSMIRRLRMERDKLQDKLRREHIEAGEYLGASLESMRIEGMSKMVAGWIVSQSITEARHDRLLIQLAEYKNQQRIQKKRKRAVTATVAVVEPENREEGEEEGEVVAGESGEVESLIHHIETISPVFKQHIDEKWQEAVRVAFEFFDGMITPKELMGSKSFMMSIHGDAILLMSSAITHIRKSGREDAENP